MTKHTIILPVRFAIFVKSCKSHNCNPDIDKVHITAITPNSQHLAQSYLLLPPPATTRGRQANWRTHHFIPDTCENGEHVHPGQTEEAECVPAPELWHAPSHHRAERSDHHL